MSQNIKYPGRYYASEGEMKQQKYRQGRLSTAILATTVDHNKHYAKDSPTERKYLYNKNYLVTSTDQITGDYKVWLKTTGSLRNFV